MAAENTHTPALENDIDSYVELSLNQIELLL